MHSTKLTEIAAVSLKLGTIAFGGPAAHVSMMEEEVVTRRKWINRQHFLDLVGITNLIPGPNSAEITMHCGYERGGKPGLIIAGAVIKLGKKALKGLEPGILGAFYFYFKSRIRSQNIISFAPILAIGATSVMGMLYSPSWMPGLSPIDYMDL